MEDVPNEILRTPDWLVDHRGGRLRRLHARFGGALCGVPMRRDAYAGMCWLIDGAGVPLSAVRRSGRPVYTGRFSANGLALALSLSYAADKAGRLTVSAALQNEADTATPPFRASLRLGFDTFLAQYPDYNDQLFPTLLRCEKTHLWGYFSSPSGRLLALFTDAPTASYTLDYEKNAQGIFTASLDLLQPGRLPARHPQGLDRLSAGEKKTWHVTLLPVGPLYGIGAIKPAIAGASLLPVLHAGRYTLAADEACRVTVFSRSPLPENTLTLNGPDGGTRRLPLEPDKPGVYRALFRAAGAAPGLYTARVRNAAGYEAEMCLFVRRPWSWYIQAARKAAADAPQKASTHAESWYGFYSAYTARRYFPDAVLDGRLERRFHEVYPLLYQSGTGLPLVQKDRIQNHSSMLGIFVCRYACTADIADLEQAHRLAELVLRFQREDGGFYKGDTDYTSVIYPAKSIMELVRAQLARAEDARIPPEDRALWRGRAERHMAALYRAMEHLAGLDGNFQTEGATASCYEDGANSCSAAQLSEFALMLAEDSPDRERYTEAARRILEKHVSHEQALVPDCRMAGGTLRFWEAQYDVEMGGTPSAPRAQMMNSPHGWSAWNIYGLFHLYELTGEVRYLERGMNAMGACAQLMGLDGTLRWAFVPDPQRQARVFVKDEAAAAQGRVAGRHAERTIGEEYVPMISSWWTAPPHTQVSGYTAMGGAVTQGAACDNDVHEVFKAMGELVLTKAYIAETGDGHFECYNASCTPDGEGLVVTPAEDVVAQVSVRLTRERAVAVRFSSGMTAGTVTPGKPRWICAAERPARAYKPRRPPRRKPNNEKTEADP